MSQFEPNLIAIIAAGAVVLLLVLSFLLFRKRGTRKFSRPLGEFRIFLQECKERLEIISPHAHEYFNSLGGDGARAYAHLTRIMTAIEERIQKVEELAEIGNSKAIKEAQELLGSNFTFDVSSVKSVMGEEKFPDLPVERVEIIVEKLFQDLGRRIATASHHSGLPKSPSRKRRDTFHSLYQAGINVSPPERKKTDDEE